MTSSYFTSGAIDLKFTDLFILKWLFTFMFAFKQRALGPLEIFWRNNSSVAAHGNLRRAAQRMFLLVYEPGNNFYLNAFVSPVHNTWDHPTGFMVRCTDMVQNSVSRVAQVLPWEPLTACSVTQVSQPLN